MDKSKININKKIDKIFAMEKREKRMEFIKGFFFKGSLRYFLLALLVPVIYYLDSPVATGTIYEGKVEEIKIATVNGKALANTVKVRLDNGRAITIKSNIVQNDQRIKIQENITRFSRRRNFTLVLSVN